MRFARFGAGLAMAALAAGCSVKAPTLPTRNVPAGVVMFQFTRKVRGPVELTLDGVRIPVTQKVKTGQHLVVRGLAPGRHRYFLSGPREAFGPDQGEFELGGDQGVFLRTFSIEFDSVLYGKQDASPAAEGLPGVQASLEK
jgi:hypothetical protein